MIKNEPVSSKKTEKELKTLADLFAPDKDNNPIKIGKMIDEKENKPLITVFISEKKSLTKIKIEVARMNEKIIFIDDLTSPNFCEENDLNISKRITIIKSEIKKRKLVLK